MKKYNMLVLLFSVLLCLGFIYAFISNLKSTEKFIGKYHIVCARYNKDVDFLKETGLPYSVIQKGEGEGEVPNKAHEGTSYLYYIIKNYDNLPDNMIFIHDENKSWHHDGKITDNLNEWINIYEKKGNGYYNINKDEFSYIKIENIYDKRIKPHYLNDAGKKYWDDCMKPTFGHLNERLFKFSDTKCCAQFIVAKDVVRRHKKKFYEKIYNWLIYNTVAEGNGDETDMYSGYMTSRYMEHSWGIMFLAPIKT